MNLDKFPIKPHIKSIALAHTVHLEQAMTNVLIDKLYPLTLDPGDDIDAQIFVGKECSDVIAKLSVWQILCIEQSVLASDIGCGDLHNYWSKAARACENVVCLIRANKADYIVAYKNSKRG